MARHAAPRAPAAPLGLGSARRRRLLDACSTAWAKGTYDPRGVPSMLIGKPLPRFSLPGQPPSQGFSSADVTAGGPARAGQLLRLLVHALRAGGAGADDA